LKVPSFQSIAVILRYILPPADFSHVKFDIMLQKIDLGTHQFILWSLF